MSGPETAEHKNVERVFARAFTVLGGIFWIGAAFSSQFSFGHHSLLGAFQTAVYPIAFTIAVLAVGWFYERFAAFILVLGAVGTIAWGFIDGRWEPFVWGIMLAFFVGPTIISAVLFYLADNVPGTRTDSKGSAGAAA